MKGLICSIKRTSSEMEKNMPPVLAELSIEEMQHI